MGNTRNRISRGHTSHKVFEEVLLLKKPDVILALQCQTKNAESPIVRSLCEFKDGTPRPSVILVFRGLHPNTYLRPDYTANLDQSEIDGLEGGLRLCFRSAFLALQGKRSVRWNNYNTPLKPWSSMCSIIAEKQGLSKEDAKDMPPDHFFRSVGLVRVPPFLQYLAKAL